jgi:NADH-dependent peroxiredoxin subunit C
MNTLVGQKAPEFVADAYINGEIKKVSLSDYKGHWVVLYFYPADFTFVCPTELTAVAHKYSQLQEMDVTVLSISIDTPYTHRAWNEHELSKIINRDIPYPMLSDKAAMIGKTYGVYDEELGVDLRGKFLIDPDGIIQSVEILNAPVGRAVGEMIRQIKAFQHVRANVEEAAPAGWEPGQATLKPGVELVGKVCEVWSVD